MLGSPGGEGTARPSYHPRWGTARGRVARIHESTFAGRPRRPRRGRGDIRRGGRREAGPTWPGLGVKGAP
ncbi:hypothetical protein D187_003832 [Cystobacter fuscus DSM 2262]|uniref:Uncharacterized protein n=1 Tax=Cystobacter fuscus (strain ATCC 25194 / DSM 2262 / NBRC 100088 / M29) TaxID=1242864 RepID=S9QBG3_CYSF2|nr:hypothetical protein D187_003832 [Cystobacter fuscus DSM 2262]